MAPDYIPLHGITRTTGRAAGSKKPPPGLLTSAAPGGDEEPCGGAGSGSDEEPEEVMRLKFTTETARCADHTCYSCQ